MEYMDQYVMQLIFLLFSIVTVGSKTTWTIPSTTPEETPVPTSTDSFSFFYFFFLFFAETNESKKEDYSNMETRILELMIHKK